MSQEKSRGISRRVLLHTASLGVLGMAANKGFAQTQNKPPYEGAVPLKGAAYYTPGLLARIRLGEETVARLRSATGFAALRGRIDFGTPENRYYQKTYTESSRFPQNGSSGARPAEQARMIKRLTDLLVHDGIWKPSRWENETFNADFTPDFEFRVSEGDFKFVVAICSPLHVMKLRWETSEKNVKFDTVAFDPVGKEMVAFIKTAFPDDAAVQELAFTPRPVPAPVTRPASVSPERWAAVMSIKPGMTRANLNSLFNGQGGMAGRTFQGFYARDIGYPKPGAYLTMIAEFAPANADLVWYDGKGFFRNPEEQAKAAQSHPFLDSDIITYIGPFQWANGLVMD